jgi:hypothetical protein
MCPVPRFAIQALISIESPKEEEGEREKRRRKKNIYRHLSHRPASLCREAKKKRYPYAEQKRKKKADLQNEKPKQKKKTIKLADSPANPDAPPTYTIWKTLKKQQQIKARRKKGKKEKTSRLCIIKPPPLDTAPNPPTMYCSFPPDCRYSVVVDNEVL